jgi:hypothetical protein
MQRFATMTNAELSNAVQCRDAILDEISTTLLESGELHPVTFLAPREGDERSDFRKRAKQIVDEYINSNIALMRHLVCERYNYCAAKKRHAARLELIRSLTDTLGMYLTKMPIPIFHICTYLVEFEVLDKLCNCPESK